MAYATLITGPYHAVEGNLADVHTAAKNPIGTVMQGLDDLGGYAEYMYLPGCTGGALGLVCSFDLYGAGTPTATALSATAKGQIAVQKAALIAATFGWYAIVGVHQALTVASQTAGNLMGRQTTDGNVGASYASGDGIYNWMLRQSITPAGLAYHQFSRPFVTDTSGF